MKCAFNLLGFNVWEAITSELRSNGLLGATEIWWVEARIGFIRIGQRIIGKCPLCKAEYFPGVVRQEDIEWILASQAFKQPGLQQTLLRRLGFDWIKQNVRFDPNLEVIQRQHEEQAMNRQVRGGRGSRGRGSRGRGRGGWG